MKRMTTFALLLMAANAMAVDTQPPLATPAQQELYRKLLEEVRCMVCQNQNLADSDAPLARDMRRELHKMVKDGASEDDVKQFLLDRYGDFRALPATACTQHLAALGWPGDRGGSGFRHACRCYPPPLAAADPGTRMSAFAWFAIVAGILILAAVACVAVPLWRDRARPISTAALTAVCLLIPALGLLTYFQSSNHEWAHSELQIGDGGQPLALERLVGPLRERLEQSPQDAQGWMLLGASYSQLGDYPQAVEAFDRVLALTGGRDPDALMGKAEALILESPERLLQEAGDMVEQALEFDPTHPKGLWYGGLRASARGETVTAVRRWRAMLEGPVTPEVREIVERELANLGASGPSLAAPADANAGASTGIVELRLSLAEGASTAARRSSIHRGAHSRPAGAAAGRQAHRWRAFSTRHGLGRWRRHAARRQNFRSARTGDYRAAFRQRPDHAQCRRLRGAGAMAGRAGHPGA